MEPPQAQPDEEQTAPWLASPPAEPPKERRGWRWLAVPAALAAGGLLVGAAAGAVVMSAVNDPTQSDEYAAQAAKLERAEEQVDAREELLAEVNVKLDEARETAQAERAAFQEREGALAAAEQAVAEREAAVTATEEQIAARSVGPGIWTVGVDIEPGIYRTDAPVSGQCYWGIYRTGSNQSDIIDNAIVSGGFPQVTLSVGQDFENTRCGTFVKQ
jgi:hypothetical protein